jgi:hypothetical protein
LAVPLDGRFFEAFRFSGALGHVGAESAARATQGSRMLGVAAAGLHSAVVKIGGVPIKLLMDSPSFLRLVKERYDSFLSPESQTGIELAVDVDSNRRVSEKEDICVVREHGQWSAERLDFRLDWDPRRKSGTLQQGPNVFSLDTALRILHTLLLAEQVGFLLHASSAVRNGRAFLFFGPSGAGKTTIVRAAPADTTLLTDEISYVRRHGENYLAYGTPFTGELGKSGENTSAPIAAFYQLVKASRNQLIPIKPADGVRALLESVLFFAEDPKLVNLVFQTTCDLVCQVPVYRLEFVPDQSVWELVQ